MIAKRDNGYARDETTVRTVSQRSRATGTYTFGARLVLETRLKKKKKKKNGFR
jgi:hypothetical protein